MKIVRTGSQASSWAPGENFTGMFRRDPLLRGEKPSRVQTGCVTFEPGARTVWHSYPLGQALIVMIGCGWVQSWGKPIEEVRAGDTVWFSAGEKHWHGATSTIAMTHIAVTDALASEAVEWLEPVTCEQYLARLEKAKLYAA